MEALIIINSLLMAVCLYFIKDFHGDFKEVKNTVNGLKEKFTEMSVKVNTHIKSVKKRMHRLDDEKNSKA